MARLSTLPRVVLLITVVTLSFLLLASTGWADGGGQATATHLVRSGDTLWSVATERAGPGEDVRRLIYEIRRLNGLEGSALVPGQRLEVPVR